MLAQVCRHIPANGVQAGLPCPLGMTNQIIKPVDTVNRDRKSIIKFIVLLKFLFIIPLLYSSEALPLAMIHCAPSFGIVIA